MNGKLERAALSARGLAAAGPHMLGHGHEEGDWRCYSLWVLQAGVTLGADSGRQIETHDTPIERALDWRERHNSCRLARTNGFRIVLPVHA